jgi:hypothetical protein
LYPIGYILSIHFIGREQQGHFPKFALVNAWLFYIDKPHSKKMPHDNRFSAMLKTKCADFMPIAPITKKFYRLNVLD